MTKIAKNNTPWFQDDGEGVAYLAARRDRAELGRPVMHRFHGDGADPAAQLSAHLLGFGFEIIDNPAFDTPAGSEFTLTFRKGADMTPDSIASTRRVLDGAATKYDWAYDAWSTYVVLAPRRRFRPGR